jgi:hypothetical protein
MLQKFRAASEDPEVARRHAARVAMNEVRLVRMEGHAAGDVRIILARAVLNAAILLEM